MKAPSNEETCANPARRTAWAPGAWYNVLLPKPGIETKVRSAMHDDNWPADPTYMMVDDVSVQ